MRHAVGAGEQDAVLFTGQGTAAALRTLLRHLDLSKSTVVFVGPFEHHANLRPWRELDVKVGQPADKFTWKSQARLIQAPDKRSNERSVERTRTQARRIVKTSRFA